MGPTAAEKAEFEAAMAAYREATGLRFPLLHHALLVARSLGWRKAPADTKKGAAPCLAKSVGAIRAAAKRKKA